MMKEIKISVMPRYTGGYAGAFAITPTVTHDPDLLIKWPWSITHIESGKSLGKCADFDTAEELTDFFDEFFYWLVEKEVPPETKKRIFAILAPYKEAKVFS